MNYPALQVAYFRGSLANRAKRCVTKKDKSKHLLAKGNEDRIWISTLCPEGVPDFRKYMTQRMKMNAYSFKTKVQADTQQEQQCKISRK